MKTDDTLLTAYVDGELDAAGVAEIEAAMAADPALARRVRVLRDATAALRAVFNDVAREPVPERLLAPLGAQAPHPWRVGALRRYAAAAAVLAVAALGALALLPAIGIELPYAIVAQQQDGWLASVSNYHQVYVRSQARDDRSLVDIGGEDRDYLEAWFGRRLKRDLRLPRLEAVGFRLQGGRVVFVETQPAAQFFYKAVDGGDIVSFTVAETKRKDAGWTEVKRGGLGVIYWRKNGYAYVFAGAVGREVLERAASTMGEREEKI
jgi:anti-sigma factor RsiW